MADPSSPRGSDISGAADRSLREARSAAAGQAEQFAASAGGSPQRLAPHGDSLAGYAQRIGEGAAQLAEQLRTRNLDEVFRDLQSFARRDPATFLIGSFAAGIAISRLMRASGHKTGSRAEAGSSLAQESSRLHQTVAAGMSRPAGPGEGSSGQKVR